ncbi:HAMP domain-containing sensor histidine kinase [Nitrosopumilus sp. b3]|uniref:sensor histidine kinase n=1 Tax=Nitrosopumilus sp. b3 TaxID=2109909 RepID=UPI00210774D4|nr:HAMP domain-containing sensor histidine kinase [Nitrosopumilus sp. b3]
MHRENQEDSDFDPMNAPQRTVFFKKSKPTESEKIDDFSNEDKPKEKEEIEKISENTQASQNLKEDDENLDETDKKLISLKNEIENAKKSHEITKQRLSTKSKSLKKAKSTLTQTQKKLDEVLSAELNKFESSKLEMIGKLSSKMAHDIRNPLTTLQSQIELMKVKQKNHEDQVLTNSILNMEEAISHITNQINDVLGFIRTPELRMITCDLKEIVKNSISEVKLPNNIELFSSLESCLLQCDVIKIRGIITNIIQNAVQAIRVKGEVNVTLETEGDYAVVKVSDTGPGIPDEHLEQIFEPMYTTKDEGTGLGLASCKQFLDMHNGSISVSNNPTTFTIKLPKTKSS